MNRNSMFFSSTEILHVQARYDAALLYRLSNEPVDNLITIYALISLRI